MTNTQKPIQVGYGENQVIFYPRMISVAEEDDYDVRFSDISRTDEKRFDKEFELCKKALGEFYEKMPERLVKENGEFKKVALVEGAETAFAAIDSYFKERTPENERMIRKAYNLFKGQLDPDWHFL